MMEIVLGVLAVFGGVILLWCIVGMILLPVSGCDMVTIWRVSGPCTELEYRVRGYLLLCNLGLCGARLALVDCGLSPQSAAVARRLADDCGPVDLISPEKLQSYLDQVRTEDGRS